MNKEKLRHYANVLTAHAESPWVTPLFFLLFLIDSVILIIPVDTLLAATVTLKPQQRRRWVLASVVGFAVGLGLVAIVANTQLQPYLFHLFQKWGYIQHVMAIMAHAENWGYIELTVSVFTFLPSLFGVLIGVVVGLNPWFVWVISLGGKVAKILVTVWLIFGGSQLLKKLLRPWLKTSL